jgi:hypothetical protein
MAGLTVQVVLQDMTKLQSDALIVGFHQNVRPLKHLAGKLDWLLCGSLSNLILNGKLRGAVGDVGLLTSRGKVPAQKIFMVGLGTAEGNSSRELADAAKTGVFSAINAGVRHAALECFSSRLPYETSIPAIISGVVQAAGANDIRISLIAPDAAAYEQISELLIKTGTA